MGADLLLASLDRELNSHLWDSREEAWATVNNTEPDSPEHNDALETAVHIMFELWDNTAQFRDPYTPASLSAYLGYGYREYTAAGLALAEEREPEEGDISRITPQGAAKLLKHLEEAGSELITGPEALGKVEEYWRLYYWGGQEGNPSEAIQMSNMLQSLLSPDVKPGYTPEEAEESLVHWRGKYEKLCNLLREAVERGEDIECSL